MTIKTAFVGAAAPRAFFHAPAGLPTISRGPQVAYAPDDAAASGPLSMDAAVGLLSAAEPDEQAAQPVAEVADAEPQPEIETPPTGDEDASEAAEPGDGEPEVETEAAAEPVEAPQWWDAEDKAAFAALSPELQAIVVKQEGKREAITTKEKQKASEARQKAEQEVSNLAPLRQALETILPQAQQVFASKWDGVTDAALAEFAQQDPVQAFQLKTQRDADLSELNRLRAVNEAAETQAYQQFLEREAERLPQVAPDLADPEKGPARKEALGKFLVTAGIPVQAVNQADAVMLSIAYDAMRYRELASSAKAKVLAKPAPAPARPALKPVGAPAASNQTETQRLSNRLSQTRSMDDGVALMIAKGL